MPGLSATMFNEINTIAIFVLGVISLLLQKPGYNSKTCTFSASNEINNINCHSMGEQNRGKAAIQRLAASLNITRQSYQYHGYPVSILWVKITCNLMGFVFTI